MTEEAKKKYRRRKWKIMIFFIAGILSIVAIAPLFINQIIEHNIKEKLKQLAPFVTVRFSSIQANLLNSSIAINELSVKFQPDLSDSSHYHLINYSKAAFTGVKFFAVVLHNELAINKTTLSNGEVTLDPFLLSKKDSLPHELLSRMSFKNVSINHLETRETHVRMHLKKSNRCKISKMEIVGLNKSVDSSFHFTSFRCSISNIDYSIPHAYRTLHIDSLDADSKKKSVKIAGVTITTQYSRFEYGKKLGRQADYIKATIPFIDISEINIEQLLQKKLVADKIRIDRGSFYFFRDRRLSRQLKKQPMPNDYLEQLPIEVRVNTFKINNASVISEEFPKAGNHSGYIAIYRMNIAMSPFLNHPTKNDPVYSTTYVEGSVMKAGVIKATIRAPLRKNIYFIKGEIVNLYLPRLNPSAENLGRFHIRSGILNSLDFHFTATEEKATGEIVGEYHDLVIDRLKEKNGEMKIAKVPSFFLHHLIIRKNKDKSLNVKKRTGKIDYARDPTRLVTFYLLKSLLDGIRSSFTLGFLLPK